MRQIRIKDVFFSFGFSIIYKKKIYSYYPIMIVKDFWQNFRFESLEIKGQFKEKV